MALTTQVYSIKREKSEREKERERENSKAAEKFTSDERKLGSKTQKDKGRKQVIHG